MISTMQGDDSRTGNPSDFIRNVARREDGTWRPPGTSTVSYPAGGHDACFGVEETSFWFAHRNRCIAAIVERFPPPPALPVVDAGGGNGYVAKMLQDLGHRTILVEPGDSGIRNARARGLAELVQASTDDLEFGPGSIGAIGLFDVIEHIPDDRAALRSLHPALAPGGRIYATVPAHAWLWSSADDRAGHQRRYTTHDMRELFRDCGFEPTFVSYYFWPLPGPMLARRVLLERVMAKRDPAGRTRSEHAAANRWVDRLLAWEEARLRLGRTIPMGASCIVAATKKHPDEHG